MRSGYLHPETKYGFVLNGEVEVWVLTNTGTDKMVCNQSALFGSGPVMIFDVVVIFIIRSFSPHGFYLVLQMVVPQIYLPTETFVIRPYTPHILHFLKDSVIVEWWDLIGSGDASCWYYHPYRRIVDIQNSLLSTSTGQHHYLVPQTDFERQEQEKRGASSSGLLWMTFGLAIGMVLGGYVVRTTPRP
jgi:hypothetical protein